MYSKYDRKMNLLMIGFTPERIEQITRILKTYAEADFALKDDANDLLAFFEVSKLSLAFSKSGK